jgi:NADPH-dependent glutamate synthase beta subunit-like oxidoreductase
MQGDERYAAAIIGGATAGAEAAKRFADAGVLTVVFEQNPRPYGKVEDGLPRWHVALRKKEYATIDRKLEQAGVHYVPSTRIGRDVELTALIRDWGFHAVVLANGAWRDRPLPIEGAEAFEPRGLVYQNPFIHWFNHYPESGYAGEHYEIQDGSIIVGGGLASIDVVKVVQLELTLRALRERGIEQDLVKLETRGIPATLKTYDLRWEDLGLEGCTLYYRRRNQDMPLVDLPDDATPQVEERVAKARQRTFQKAQEKYLFRVEWLHAPVGMTLEGDRLIGITFARTQVRDRRVHLTDRTLDVRAPQVISSIGSIPEPIPGVPMRGELYDFEDWDLGRLGHYATLFSVGNVVTGKGNIVASRKHAGRVGQHVVDHHLRVLDDGHGLEPLGTAQRRRILERVRDLQERAGYTGSYGDWIAAVTPRDLA